MKLSQLRLSLIATSMQAHMPEKVFLFVALLASLPLTMTIYWIWMVALFTVFGQAGVALSPVIEYLAEPLGELSIGVRTSLIIAVIFIVLVAVMISLWLSFHNLMIVHCRHHTEGRQRRLWRLALRVPPFHPLSTYVYFFAHYITAPRWRPQSGASKADDGDAS